MQPMQKCGVLHDFNPLPPCGGRQAEMPKASATFFYFNPLPPCGGRLPAGMMAGNASYFNPLPPCGGRRKRAARAAYIADFNPLPPCGGRQRTLAQNPTRKRFQSTPSVWRETTYRGNIGDESRFQSTPSVWRETNTIHYIDPQSLISIHSLRVEGDRSFHNFGFRSKKFQSTPSVWRETSGATRLRTGGKNFNPLPPCGGRRSSRRNPPIWIAISIHSLRVEGDPHGTTPQL